MLGGLCLIAGSCMYFTIIIRHYAMASTAGGWLLSIGSFFLLLTDLQEWWHNRIGCCFDRKYRDVYEIFHKNRFQHSRSSIVVRLERTNIGTNSFMAACGSALYLAGSILLIPTFEKYVVLGDWLIIVGSTIIFLSAIWKIYRAGHINVADPYDHRFRLGNILNDISALSIDVFVAFGGAFYFLGVILSLPNFNTNDFHMNLSAAFCVAGGTSFFLASIFLQYHYYCKE